MLTGTGKGDKSLTLTLPQHLLISITGDTTLTLSDKWRHYIEGRERRIVSIVRERERPGPTSHSGKWRL